VERFDDPEAGDVLTCSITVGNTGTAFAIDPATRAITVAGASLNGNDTLTLTVIVIVTDGGGLTDTATVTIEVGEVTGRISEDAFEVLQG
jgi:hypothetical protein